MMRRLLATALFAGLGLALPAWALGQTPTSPVIEPVVIAPVPGTQAKPHKAVPVWQRGGTKLSITAEGDSSTTIPGRSASALDGQSRSTGAGVSLTTRPGITAHAGVQAVHWAPLVSACAAALPGAPTNLACFDANQAEMQRGEVGAGFAGRGVKLDVSLGQAHSEGGAARTRHSVLPRVLPAAGGADVAAPLWFNDSTATNISARGQVRVAPDTRVEVGASVGRIRFLPSAGLAGDDTLDQTTLSIGIQHGAIRGAIVGHMLDPNLPGVALDQTQRWSGVDLGISVRLPWRGELNFGAQNVWTSGRAPLLFGPDGAAPAQGRVPYVQYHQDL
ncbi:MAG TPA: hypothetical protein VFL63_08410 [Rhodanobacteraceae bacterium]|nr:hypothetical protein [Rhodanobacteraceae bacterium]